MTIYVKHHLHFRNDFINSSAIHCLCLWEMFCFLSNTRIWHMQKISLHSCTSVLSKQKQYFNTTTIVRFFYFLNDCHEELFPDSETSEALARSHTFPSIFPSSVWKNQQIQGCDIYAFVNIFQFCF